MEPLNFRQAILYVDDEPVNLENFKRAFGSDYLVRCCLSGEEALSILEKEEFPLVIADQRMPGMSGIELCERLYAAKPATVRMILTAYTETQMLLDAIGRGHVHDYIVKPWKKSELKPILDKAMGDCRQKIAKFEELRAKAAQTEILQEEIREHYDSEGIIGAHSGLKAAMETIKKAAPTDSTILLLGETGTGKELLARAIHRLSKCKSGPFIPVHCAALVKGLLESELFGHEKGAFTGADQTRVGRFEMAQGGTLFLDEIGELTPDIQVKLLRVLQERQVQRVGGNRNIPVEVRMIAATHRDLEEMVREGEFREDLYYRLNVIAIRLPPLRERREDIPLLARNLVEKFGRKVGATLELTERSLQHLARYDWPGNVRELENVIERAVILRTGSTIDPEDLNLNVDEMLQVEKVDLGKIPASGSIREQIQQKEMRALIESLTQSKGNISEAARSLGIPRTTLFNRLRKFRLI